MPPSVPIDTRHSMRAQLAYTLRLMREARSMSQNDLAKELYATRETIAAYESRRNRPDEDFCKKLDEFFGTGEMFQGLWHHAKREHLNELIPTSSGLVVQGEDGLDDGGQAAG